MPTVHFHHIKKDEISLFVRAFTDLETGNHLIRKREREELLAINEVCDVRERWMDEKKRTERDKEIMFLDKLCTDYEWCVTNGYEDLNFDEIKTDE